MKYHISGAVVLVSRRSPCGERGLKLHGGADGGNRHESLPVRGAWVEIFLWTPPVSLAAVAPRAGSVG